ncbi:hypothetical protein O181_085268 [Austropuccinia psidii MF-1]|uniref:Uncharacterized protein n=1 Tax=Austropuccinia psidii MF-1 TaxID=1389203 RepID=A0A9Q3FST9_9BASI|nr:hypothetical protein [Austropuccinia psidii MF-1]
MAPNIPFTTPITSSINLSGLHIEKDVPMAPPRIINAPGITVSSISNPTGSQGGNEYLPFPHDYLLNPSSKPSENQGSTSDSSPDKQPMIKIPPMTERRGIDQFQRSSELLNCRGYQSQGKVSIVFTCRLFFLGQGVLINLVSSNFVRCAASKGKYENKGNCWGT